MPELSQFYGITIRMYFREHGPPHFHAEYGAQEALIRIRDLAVLKGSLSPRARGLVVEWASLHQAELQQAWERVRRHESPGTIAPLD